MKLRIVLSLVVALTAVACSGGEDEAAPTTTAVTTLADPTTTAPPVTPAPTTVPFTTAPPATTQPSTSVTPVTSAPPPPTLPSDLTPAELEALRNEVMSDMQEAYEAFDAVKRNPTDTALVEQMQAVMTEERARYVIDTFVVRYVANNLAERTNPDLPARIDFLLDTFDVDTQAGTASIDYCYLSSNLLIEIGANPDGSDKLQDDQFGAVLVRNLLLFDGDRWLDAGGEDVSIRPGETECS